MLITKALEKRFREIGGQDGHTNPICVAKFFSPIGQATWYALEYNPDDNVCFGYVKGLTHGGDEFGYFSIDELESVKLPMNLSIERDIYFSEKPLAEEVPELMEFYERVQETREINERKQQSKEQYRDR